MAMKKRRTLGEFLATFEWTVSIDWVGNTGYVHLPRNRRACIQAIHGPPNSSGEYHGIRVTIVHRDRGPIFQDDFLFADQLDPADRADSRPDYRSTFHIWRCSERGYEWYIARPADTAPLADSVKRFIETFR